MRKLICAASVLLAVMLLPAACGGGSGLRGEVVDLLERHSGEIETISYTCITEDAGRLYREEFELRFPDAYRYRLYQSEGGIVQLQNLTMQSGTDLYRARVVRDNAGGVDCLQVETTSNMPPLRCTGNYLSLYHLAGNVDYFQSMIALIRGGQLEVTGIEGLDGIDAYSLESAAGLTPRMRIWLDAASGLPLRKELSLGAERSVIFRFEDYALNPAYADEPFPSDPAALFGAPGISVTRTVRDGACRTADIDGAYLEAGFEPLLPRIDGFELTSTCVRDPASSNLSESEEQMKFPEGFREVYLVMKDGARQVEIRESPYSEEFSYYTTSMGALSGAYLTGQENFGEDAGNATYTAAMDCQEMRLALGDVELVVTGDLSRDEFESLAVQLVELSRSSP